MNGSIKRAGSVGFSLAAALVLQGCVAAAFPIAAGGLLGQKTLSRADTDGPVEDAVAQAAPSQDEGLMNSDLAPVPSTPTQASPPATSARADFNAAFASPVTANTPASPELAPASASNIAAPPSEVALPPIPRPAPATAPAQAVRPLPTPIPSARASALEAIGPSGINQLLSYAGSRQVASEEAPASALLSDRLTLEPIKAQCGGVSPTILIDLDPEGALFDSTTASRPPSGLARGLSQLRENGIEVAWISGNGVDALDGIKRSLTYSGLDLRNEDRILLVRGPDDRKQTLREELSQISCLIAIAGDTRSDFDELYDYLKNPADAETLEPLIGDGWFLIPQPLL